jgi:hypothetical protein
LLNAAGSCKIEQYAGFMVTKLRDIGGLIVKVTFLHLFIPDLDFWLSDMVEGGVLEGQGKVKPLTALRWVSKCCPDVPQSLINKLFRLRQVWKFSFAGG